MQIVNEPMGPAWAQELATTIRTASFTTVRWREAYDVDQVDACLDGLEAAVLSGADVDVLLDGRRFTTVRLSPGYDMGQVDRFLDRVQHAARAARESQPSSADRRPTSRPAQPSVIQEQRGLIARLLGRSQR